MTDDLHPLAKPDGRKRRWRDHKIARREELVDGTIQAIRKRGHTAGMDDIAAEIGVSKTVLYRYFSDKNDLTSATLTRFVDTVITPRIYAAIGEEALEFELVQRAIGAYVDIIDEDTEIYMYVMGGSGASTSIVAESERMIAEMLSVVLRERAVGVGVDAQGAVPWSYALVGAIQLAVHWWISNKSMPRENFVSFLVMMTWGGVEGIARAGGSPVAFADQSHELPTPGS